MARCSLLLLIFIGHFQARTQVLLKGDCKDAQELRASFTHIFKESPHGYGEIKEMKGNSFNSLYYFQEEKHSAWFKFSTLTDGDLTFTIVPKDTSSDFDFLLFEYTNDRFCEELKKQKIKPIRSNNSRFNSEELSITGLSILEVEEFVPPGPGNHMSKAIHVEKDKEFILVLNNVYGTQGGFSINFDYYDEHEISGQVKDEETNEVIGGAEVSWEDLKIGSLAKTTTDEVTGEFNFKVPVLKTKITRPYNLVITNNNHLIIEKTVQVSTKSEKSHSIDVFMPRLKKGSRSELHSINFYGNSPKPLPSAKKGLKRILKLMEANPSLNILIEGHTNGCDNGYQHAQALSEARAKAVSLYLIKNGIEDIRLQTMGLNCSKMLFPEMKSITEQMLNRRVEIVVTNFENSKDQ